MAMVVKWSLKSCGIYYMQNQIGNIHMLMWYTGKRTTDLYYTQSQIIVDKSGDIFLVQIFFICHFGPFIAFYVVYILLDGEGCKLT